MIQTGTKDRVHFRNLDGYRGIGAILMIIYHFDLHVGIRGTWTDIILTFDDRGGRLALHFFFVLSGFLISYLLFAEQGRNGTVNLKHFYVRRILRIWPAYYLSLLIGFIIYPMVTGTGGLEGFRVNCLPMFLAFLPNFDLIMNGYPPNLTLGVHWSVGVEEQFYLLWPIVFYFFSKWKWFPILITGMIAGSGYYFFKHLSTPAAAFSLFSNFRFISTGCLLAWFTFHYSEAIGNFLAKIPKTAMVLIYLIFMVLLFYKFHIPNLFFNEILPLIFFSFVITEQNFGGNSFYKIGNFRWLSWLGKISYGFYLYHMIAISMVIYFCPLDWHWAVKLILSFALTNVFGHLSYFFYEKKFLVLKDKKFNP